MRELALGARLTLAGGRAGLLRTAITALGVALGVAVLLVAASIPSIHDGRQARGAARSDVGYDQAISGGHSVLVAEANTRFRSRDIRGRLLQAEGTGAPVPPGISRLPRVGEVFVSPALADVLATPDGRRLLAPRIPGRVVGEIAAVGLIGPTDLAYYAGASDLVVGGSVRRLAHFGSPGPGEGLDPILTLLVVIVLVALLLPVAVLVGAAVRTGGEERDRRLAALRLIGADQHMARRIAAGEALISAVAGLFLGALAFLVVRAFADRISIWDTSVYTTDVHPSLPLGAAVVAGVPAAAVLVSLLALRRVVAEPLGVVRRAESMRRRRLWWRLLLPALGLLALVPAAGKSDGRISELRVAVGVIALQMVFSGIQEEYKKDTGADLSRATLYAEFGAAKGPASTGGGAAITAATLTDRLRRAAGVTSVQALSQYDVGRDPAAPDSRLTVAPCATLREVAGVTTCHDGDVFFANEPPRAQLAFGATTWTLPKPGRQVPTRADPTGLERGGVFATPGAVRGARLPNAYVLAFVRTQPADQDAVENVRNAAAALNPRVDVRELHRTRTDGQFAQLRRAMLIGASIVIGLIGLSLLLTALEELRERRRLLAVLVAFGTRRSTLSWSVLWQSAVPIGLGIAIAVLTGIALGSVLLRIFGSVVRIAWGDVAAMAGAGVIVVLLVTAASLPVLWRTMRPEGLRTE